MQEGDVAMVLRDLFVVVLKLAAPGLLTAMGVGLVISLIQAVTQINEIYACLRAEGAGARCRSHAGRSFHVCDVDRLHAHPARPDDRRRRPVTVLPL